MLELTQKRSAVQHSAWIELRADRLLSNLEILQQKTGSPVDVLAVIKANAYGHGVAEIAKILEGKVGFFGTATLREALLLKEHHPSTPVFLFGHLFANEIPAAIGSNITVSASHYEKAKEISDCAESLGRKATVHIKIDTGMGRMGLRVKEAEQEIMKMRGLKGLVLEGIYTHFPTAEKEDAFRELQVRNFKLLIDDLERKGIVFRFRHAQNSAASLTLKNPVLNMIRPGLTLYGIYPDPGLKGLAQFEPVLSLKSRIALLKKVHPGESVGYGREFTAARETTIAVLPVGYSHGYPWAAWKKSAALYKGKRYPLAGKVSMDYIAVDLGTAPASEGDVITLIGDDHGERITAEEIAGWAGTIPYEIVTRLNAHLPRIVV
ncbi:MAG: alanine racemase [Candidatus Omnitrophica bacterium]|nr:alanine racemase [Candidatus Omnitrophota bacterium]